MHPSCLRNHHVSAFISLLIPSGETLESKETSAGFNNFRHPEWGGYTPSRGVGRSLDPLLNPMESVCGDFCWDLPPHRASCLGAALCFLGLLIPSSPLLSPPGPFPSPRPPRGSRTQGWGVCARGHRPSPASRDASPWRRFPWRPLPCRWLPEKDPRAS